MTRSATCQPPEHRTKYGYDVDRLTSVTSPAGAFTYGYASQRQSLVSNIQLPNGALISNTYDNLARLLSTILENSGHSTLNAHSYEVNQANQRTRQTFTSGNYADYGYDNIGQLTSAHGKESGGVTNRWHEQLGYVYDAAGNLSFRTNNALLQTFEVNELNELTDANRSGTLTVAGSTGSRATAVTVNSGSAILYSDFTFARTNMGLVSGSNTFTATATDSYGRTDSDTISVYLPAQISFTHDANGNLTGDGTRCFAYDDENQLTSVWVTNNWRSDFTYDGKMRRRIRREYVWQTANWCLQSETRYVYDGNLVIQERDGNNLPQVTYTRGQDLSGTFQGAGGIGGLLARTDHRLFAIGNSGAYAYYHADGNGNITCLINANQGIAAKYLYDPYGNLLSQNGPLADANLYRFSSKEFHAASGLVYYLYRFYEPSLQTWINRDPLGDGGGLAYVGALQGVETSLDTLGVHLEELERPNLFAFVINAPTDYWDAFGLTKGGKKNISCEDFTKKSCPKDVKAAMDAAKAAGQAKRYRALRGLLKVIKRGGNLIFMFFELELEKCPGLWGGYDGRMA